MKKLIMIMMFAMVGLGLAACGNGTEDPAPTPTEDGVDYPVEYFGATVVSSNVDGNTVVLTVEGEGFYPMTAEVTFTDGVITDFVVTDHSESSAWGGELIERGDMQSAIIDAEDVSAIDFNDYAEVDADSRATATVEALYDIALGAIEHFEAYYAD